MRAFLDSLNIELNLNQSKPKYRELSADFSKSSYQKIVANNNFSLKSGGATSGLSTTRSSPSCSVDNC